MAAPMEPTKTPETAAMDATKAPEAVKRLVDNFAANIDEYKSGNYNETQVRVEYIDKLYAALGWDIHNDQGNAEAYKDVIHEYSLKSQPDQKGKQSNQAPDYCFRAGGEDKFFLETKRPAANISESAAHAFQLRSYGWSAKLPISILSDFEELAVYDCQILPKASDSPATARVLLYHYQDYISKWQEIHSIFSKQAVYNGSFDRFTVSNKKKKGTLPVDKAFLQEMEGWRTLLARNIALRNSELSQKQLNHLVQATIDRIVFLRICEDRDIEPYKQLQNLLTTDNVYQELCLLFQKADDKYNSGLFHFRSEKNRLQPDALSLTLTIDNKPLTDIITKLYYPNPYVFSEIPAEILGQVYEQFLGKVIRLTAGHRAKVEEKPEVRKAGGVYYTPKYIVDYIVKNTVGELLKNKTPKQAKKIKILDPACGSGSFLIVAYQFLLDWYLSAYSKDPSEHKKLIYKTTNGNHYRLATQEKKDILLNHIFGVDIDRQAGEVTKLSLLLKVLEDENTGTLEAQRKMFQERALPDLGNNIKCGNSLIGSDFFHDKNLDMFDREQMENINAFDWDGKDGFPEIMQAGGFDCVIGNPPWGGNIDRYLNYFHSEYTDSTKAHTDSYKLFIEKAISLSKADGMVAMIVPQGIIRQRRCKDIRSLLLKYSLVQVIDLGENVFTGVVVPSSVFVVKSRERVKETFSWHYANLRFGKNNSEKNLLLSKKGHFTKIQFATVSHSSDLDLSAIDSVPAKGSNIRLLGAINGIICKDAGINYQRVKVGMQEKGKSDLGQRLLYEGRKEKSAHVMFWKGADITRYWMASKTDRYCRTECEMTLRSNEVVRLAKTIYATVPKLLIRQTADKPIATIDWQGVWFGRSILSILLTENATITHSYLLGLLNSKYLCYRYQSLSEEKGRVFAQVKFSKLKQLPLRVIDFDDQKQKGQHDHMVQLVEQMLDTQKKIHASKSKDDAESKHLQKRADLLDKQIDTLVYELYELTPEEIRLVEDG